MALRFEWDPLKAAANKRKHPLSFDTAARVFFDPLATSAYDRIEGGEHRWRRTGSAGGEDLLLVAYTSWDDGEDEVVRIISARLLSKHERKRYEQDGPLHC